MSVLSFLRRKTIRAMQICVYENEKEVNLDTLTNHHLVEIVQAIEDALNTKRGVIWFEVEAYEECGFFKKRKTFLQLHFMKENQNSSLGKTRISIPKDFIESYTQKKIPIQPKKIFVKSWPNPLSIQLSYC